MARNMKRNSKGRFVGFGRHKRSHRSYKGIGRHKRSRRFGDLPKVETYKQSAGGHDVLLGAGIGLLGIMVANYFVAKQKVPASGLSWQASITKDPWKGSALAAVAATAAGIAAFALMKDNAKRTGWLIGAAGAGIAVGGSRLVDAGYLAGSDPASMGAMVMNPNAGSKKSLAGFGALMRNAQAQTHPYGMIVKNARPASLAALSLALEDGDEIERMVGAR